MDADPRSPDTDLVDTHERRVQHLLLPMVARYEFGQLAATPEGQAVLATPPALRASLAIAALAGPSSGWSAAHLAEVPEADQWPAELIRALVRRKIDWEPDDAALALRLVAESDFDAERIQLVLRAADQMADRCPAHPAVMDGLDRLDTSVRCTPAHRYRVREMQARVVASIARHSPPELLDLSPIAETDTWGPAARDVLRDAHAHGVDVHTILGRLTAAPSSTAPSVRWSESLTAALESAAARETIEHLVRQLVELDLDPDEQRVFVATGNDSVARAAVWAMGLVAACPAQVNLLRRVAARCSRTNGRPYVTEALCAKAAGAAVTALGRMRDLDLPLALAADRALEQLWDSVDRGDLLRRIGTVLGRSTDEINRRVAEAQRTKASSKAEQVSVHHEKLAERTATSLIDDVAARLGQLGFDERTRRTFRRHHRDRTEVVTISVTAAEIRLGFGVGFHGDSERPRWRLADLDVAADLWSISTEPDANGEVPWLDHRATRLREQRDRRIARTSVDPVEFLAALLARFESVAIPVLARWADPGLLADDLDDLEVPFRHGELLLELDLPTGPQRQLAIRRLRGHGENC